MFTNIEEILFKKSWSFKKIFKLSLTTSLLKLYLRKKFLDKKAIEKGDS